MATETINNLENAANAPEIIKTHENLKEATETTDNPDNAANTPEIVKTHENLKKSPKLLIIMKTHQINQK